MTKRERMACTLAHRQPDRVPYDQSSRSSAIEQQAYDDLKRFLGLKTPTTCFLRAHADIEEPVHRLLGIDTRFIRYMPPESWHRDGQDDLFVDPWRVPWRRRGGSYYYELDGNPLAGLEYDEILRARWAPLVSKEMSIVLRQRAKSAHQTTDDALFSDQIGAGLFERAWYLRGFEQFLVDLMLEKAAVHRFMERLLEHQMQGYADVFEAVGPYVEGVLLTDDLATQDSLIVSRDLYREMIFPYQKRLFDFIASFGKHLIYHSCGAVHPLIPDLMEAGVRILHPIQRSACGMDPLSIKREFGRDLTLWGAGCDTAFLQQAAPAEVVDDVVATLDALGGDGGFVYTPTHCIQPETNPRNILAMAGVLRGFRAPRGHELDWLESVDWLHASDNVVVVSHCEESP